MKKRPNPAPAHHAITTAWHPDNISSSALVQGHPLHGQPMSLATKAMPRNEVTFCPFSREISLSPSSTSNPTALSRSVLFAEVTVHTYPNLVSASMLFQEILVLLSILRSLVPPFFFRRSKC